MFEIKSKYTIYNCPEPDVIIFAGADNIDKLIKNDEFKEITSWVNKIAKDKSKIIMSVCTGSIILGSTGLLDNKKSTTHSLFFDVLRNKYPKTTVIENVDFIEDGNILTTAGITKGIDGALHLIKKYDGEELFESLKKIMYLH